MKRKVIFGGLGLLFFCFSTSLVAPIEKLSVAMEIRTLLAGKSMIAKGDVYYRAEGGLMVTRVKQPVEQVIINNARGELKSYDVLNNTVTQMEDFEYSTRYSFFYQFFSSTIRDMGLTDMGYILKNTKTENKLVITSWDLDPNRTGKLKKAELVHENFLPIYLAFFDVKNRPVRKIYYSNFTEAGNYRLPFSITEFEYLPDGDSLITKKVYSDLKLNSSVENIWLNFKIPSNAKLIRPQDVK